MNNLLDRLATAGLVDGGMIVLERFPDGQAMTAVPVDTFRDYFGDALDSAEPGREYDALIAADQGKGYARVFDSWLAAGLI
jgi:hypothetical protein